MSPLTQNFSVEIKDDVLRIHLDDPNTYQISIFRPQLEIF